MLEIRFKGLLVNWEFYERDCLYIVILMKGTVCIL